MYYSVDDKNNIVSASDVKFPGALETGRPIVRGRDGLLYFAGEEPALALADIAADYELRIQRRLDNFARTLTYENMLSACTYASSSIEMYRIEGQYCVDARDATWAKAYELFTALLPAAATGGPVPTWEEIEAELPPLAWPEGSRLPLTAA